MTQTVQVNEVLIALLAAAIGYGFGLLRDANRAKTEREARYQDEVLSAASELLLKCEEASEARGTYRSLAPTFSKAMERAKTDSSKHAEAAQLRATMMASAETVGVKAVEAQPHRLKLLILAPALEGDVQRLMKTAGTAGFTLGAPPADEGPPTEKDQEEAYFTAAAAFTEKVRQFLKVPKRRRRA